jgi:uncharacterized membrane protein YphA (DoxX/SURF4 family)
MKSLLSNPIFILIVRAFLGGLFVVSSLDKIIYPEAFTVSILNYKVVDETFAILTATTLPWLELICGFLLIIGVYSRTSALILTTLLMGFTILIVSALIRGLDISCGCFTQDPNAEKIGYRKILENVGFILMGVYLVFAKVEGITLLQVLRKKSDFPPSLS